MTGAQIGCLAAATLCLVVAFGLAAAGGLSNDLGVRPLRLLWAALAVDALTVVPVIGLIVVSG
jgi:hypothetical protein